MKKVLLGPIPLNEAEGVSNKLSACGIAYECLLEEAPNLILQENVFRTSIREKNFLFEILEADLRKNIGMLEALPVQFEQDEDATLDNRKSNLDTSDKQLPSFEEWFLKPFLSGFSRFADFRGCSDRGEFWTYQITSGLIVFMMDEVHSNPDFATKAGALRILPSLLILVLLIPYISLAVRRLHDIGKSGWWSLLAYIPFINLYFLWLCLRPSKD